MIFPGLCRIQRLCETQLLSEVLRYYWDVVGGELGVNCKLKILYSIIHHLNCTDHGTSLSCCVRAKLGLCSKGNY